MGLSVLCICGCECVCVWVLKCVRAWTHLRLARNTHNWYYNQYWGMWSLPKTSHVRRDFGCVLQHRRLVRLARDLICSPSIRCRHRSVFQSVTTFSREISAHPRVHHCVVIPVDRSPEILTINLITPSHNERWTTFFSYPDPRLQNSNQHFGWTSTEIIFHGTQMIVH